MANVVCEIDIADNSINNSSGEAGRIPTLIIIVIIAAVVLLAVFIISVARLYGKQNSTDPV